MVQSRLNFFFRIKKKIFNKYLINNLTLIKFKKHSVGKNLDYFPKKQNRNYFYFSKKFFFSFNKNTIIYYF